MCQVLCYTSEIFKKILLSWGYFLSRGTDINNYNPPLYPTTFLVTILRLLRGWLHLTHLCVPRKAPDTEWAFNTCILKERTNIKL